jgi:hypothetical protein
LRPWMRVLHWLPSTPDAASSFDANRDASATVWVARTCEPAVACLERLRPAKGLYRIAGRAAITCRASARPGAALQLRGHPVRARPFDLQTAAAGRRANQNQIAMASLLGRLSKTQIVISFGPAMSNDTAYTHLSCRTAPPPRWAVVSLCRLLCATRDGDPFVAGVSACFAAYA